MKGLTRRGTNSVVMTPQTILWVDLRTVRSGPNLCGSLPPVYRTERLLHLADLFQAVQTWRPWAMCFEYDTPDARGLGALLEVKARYASLPIIVLTEKRVGTREIPALRAGVSRHLVKPVSVERFCQCLTTIPVDHTSTAGGGSVAPVMSYVAAN